MKLVAVIFLLSASVTGLASGNSDRAEGDHETEVQVGKKVLIRTFAFGPVGNAGTTSGGERYFFEVLLSHGAKGFIELFERGDAQAKAYALVGLKWLGDDQYERLRDGFVDERVSVMVTEGCIMTDVEARVIVDRIDAREWDDHITATAKKKKANQPSQPTRSARG